jgi:hypothetical protein
VRDPYQSLLEQLSWAFFVHVNQQLTKEQTMNNTQSNQTKIDLLTASIANSKKVEIDYTDSTGEKTTREITVQNVAFDSSTRRWNVSAVCHLRGGVRTFIVDSITAVREESQVMVSLGDRVIIGGSEYVIAATAADKVAPISVATGHRWTDGITWKWGERSWSLKTFSGTTPARKLDSKIENSTLPLGYGVNRGAGSGLYAVTKGDALLTEFRFDSVKDAITAAIAQAAK